MKSGQYVIATNIKTKEEYHVINWKIDREFFKPGTNVTLNLFQDGVQLSATWVRYYHTPAKYTLTAFTADGISGESWDL